MILILLLTYDLQKIATIRNETSYLSNEKIDQAIGDLMKPGRITSNVDMDFNVIFFIIIIFSQITFYSQISCKDLSGIHNEMTIILEKVLSITSQFDYNNDDSNNACPVDKSCIDKATHQLKQTMVIFSMFSLFIYLTL